MVTKLYFQDFTPGQEFITGSYMIPEDKAVGFAQEYDPQYFHIDAEAASDSPFGRLVVSGWQTAAISMRLKITTDLRHVAGGMIGMGLESVKWPRPVYPGDTLRAVIRIVDTRRSGSKPTHGVVKYVMETFNQNDEKVLEMQTAIWVPAR